MPIHDHQLRSQILLTQRFPELHLARLEGLHSYKTEMITLADETYVFDCFECAIHELAPVCAHCGCRVIGHGVEGGAEGAIYCCNHCAEMMDAA